MKYRVYYGIYLLITFLLAFFLRDKFSVALLLTLLLLPPLSFLSLFLTKKKFTCRQDISESGAVKGQTVRYELHLKNGGRFFLPHIIIKYHEPTLFSYSNPPAPSLFLSPKEKKWFSLSVECKFRGRCDIGVKKIELWDFLRLFKLSITPGEALYLTIHPKLHPVGALSSATAVSTIETRAFFKGDDDYTTISDFRNYTDSDSIKKVHWKLSAKKEELIVKEFASHVSSGTAVALDLSPLSDYGERTTEIEDSMVGLAVSIIRQLAEKSENADFYYNTGCPETLHVGNMGDFSRLYSLSALLTFTSEVDFKLLLEAFMHSGAQPVKLFILTAGLDPDFCDRVAMLSAIGCGVTVVDFSGLRLSGSARTSLYGRLRTAGVRVSEPESYN
ncbi:MAG TPA: hypothetical protein DEQ02_04625 [Ruminococcaceae bacterium]|nr:hypothetical protein [Oscillospiraceae bacterium]